MQLHRGFLRALQLLMILPHKRPENIEVNESSSHVMLATIMRVQRVQLCLVGGRGRESEPHAKNSIPTHIWIMSCAAPRLPNNSARSLGNRQLLVASVCRPLTFWDFVRKFEFQFMHAQLGSSEAAAPAQPPQPSNGTGHRSICSANQANQSRVPFRRAELKSLRPHC